MAITTVYVVLSLVVVCSYANAECDLKTKDIIRDVHDNSLQ
jgi:hypothetical protein